MRHNFRTEFLVCLDLSEDVNYVVGRSPSMDGARDLARKAKTLFPDDKVYITKEMVLRQTLSQLVPDKRALAANPEPVKSSKPVSAPANTSKCKCGKKAGQCVGSLGCQCNPIAMCKKADKWENPVEEDSSDEDDLSDFDVEEDFEYEEDESEDEADEDSEEVRSNPEVLEEEEFEEDYRDNPDEEEFEDEDEDEDDDYEDEDEEDDEEDDEEEDDDGEDGD